jgi:hypothetical protein
MQDVHEPIRATPQRGQRAEGQRAAAILAAEGRSSAIDQVFQTVHRNDPDPKAGGPIRPPACSPAWLHRALHDPPQIGHRPKLGVRPSRT